MSITRRMGHSQQSEGIELQQRRILLQADFGAECLILWAGRAAGDIRLTPGRPRSSFAWAAQHRPHPCSGRLTVQWRGRHCAPHRCCEAACIPAAALDSWQHQNTLDGDNSSTSCLSEVLCLLASTINLPLISAHLIERNHITITTLRSQSCQRLSRTVAPL